MFANLQLIDTSIRDSKNSSPISESFQRKDISLNFDTYTKLLNVTKATEIIQDDISLMYSRLKFINYIICFILH